MKIYTEFVSFVPQVLDDFQRYAVFIKVKRNRIPGEINFFKFFGDADNGQRSSQSQAVYTFHGRRKLAFSSVDDYQLR